MKQLDVFFLSEVVVLTLAMLYSLGALAQDYQLEYWKDGSKADVAVIKKIG